MSYKNGSGRGREGRRAPGTLQDALARSHARALTHSLAPHGGYPGTTQPPPPNSHWDPRAPRRRRGLKVSTGGRAPRQCRGGARRGEEGSVGGTGRRESETVGRAAGRDGEGRRNNKCHSLARAWAGKSCRVNGLPEKPRASRFLSADAARVS